MTEESSRFPSLSTLSVHAGEAREKSDFAIADPIHCASTFTFANTAAIIEMLENEGRTLAGQERDEYARYSSPNVRTAEKKLAALERTEEALLCTTGMSALSLLFWSYLRPGDHLLFFDRCYHRTRQFCQDFLEPYGIRCEAIPTGDFAALEAALRPETRLIFSELPTNPHLDVIDLERLTTLAQQRGIKTCIDTTLASPINLRPREWGADFVVHSATKYLGGHNDLLAGVLAGSKSDIAPVRKLQGISGAIAAPHTAYLLQRGLKTLALRIQQQNRSGQRIAEFLAQHPRVERVYYPGLETHPSYALARRYLSGFGGLVSFELKADLKATSRFIDAVRIPRIGPSLGGVESLIEQPTIMSFYRASVAERRRWNISDSLVRLAIGIEDPEDLVADLSQALSLTETF